jgi:hypothetical protein
MLSHCHTTKMAEMSIQSVSKYLVKDVVGVFLPLCVIFWAIVTIWKRFNMRPFSTPSTRDSQKPAAHLRKLKQSDRKPGGSHLHSQAVHSHCINAITSPRMDTVRLQTTRSLPISRLGCSNIQANTVPALQIWPVSLSLS